MIEEPKPLTIKKNWERPSKKQLKAFENIPTGFVTDALNGEGTLSIDIKPVSYTHLRAHETREDRGCPRGG